MNSTFISNKWGSKWKASREQLSKEGFLHQLKHRETWFVEITHFVLKCIPVVNPISHWNTKLESITINHNTYPAVAMNADHGILTARDNCTMNEFTIEEAIGKITCLVYLTQYFEYHMAKLGYERRVFGDQNNLFRAKHVVHVAGPYDNPSNAERAVKDIQMIEKSMTNNASRGHVTLKVGKEETLFFSLSKSSLSLFSTLSHSIPFFRILHRPYFQRNR